MFAGNIQKRADENKPFKRDGASPWQNARSNGGEKATFLPKDTF